MERLARHYPRHPFVPDKTPDRRFHLNNSSYPQSDALLLFCMLAELQPRRVIEIGSGFTSAAMLDANERVFRRSMTLTFIDPDMSRLRALLQENDESDVTVIEQRVQDVDLGLFRQLAANANPGGGQIWIQKLNAPNLP